MKVETAPIDEFMMVSKSLKCLRLRPDEHDNADDEDDDGDDGDANKTKNS